MRFTGRGFNFFRASRRGFQTKNGGYWVWISFLKNLTLWFSSKIIAFTVMYIFLKSFADLKNTRGSLGVDLLQNMKFTACGFEFWWNQGKHTVY